MEDVLKKMVMMVMVVVMMMMMELGRTSVSTLLYQRREPKEKYQTVTDGCLKCHSMLFIYVYNI
jgi:hypothetical protein